ncbi:MAG: hypothetical protein AAGF04_03770 [Chlamydiota bacterium]
MKKHWPAVLMSLKNHILDHIALFCAHVDLPLLRLVVIAVLVNYFRSPLPPDNGMPAVPLLPYSSRFAIQEYQ